MKSTVFLNRLFQLKFFTLLFTLSIGIHLMAQATIVKGTLLNKENKPIPFVVVMVEGTEIVTASNEFGKYELDLSPGEYEITVSSMEYASVTKKIQVAEEEVVLDFELTIQTFAIDSVVVTASEDLGVRIMRQVIAKRKDHAQKIKTLESDIYLKGSMRIVHMPKKIMGQEINDTMFNELGLDSIGRGIMYLLEQNAHYYFQQPNKEFNFIQSVRTSGDPQGLGFAQMPPITNIYENNIPLLGGLNDRGFISPASSNALYYYDFKFEGSYEEKGQYISKIKVIPKRKYEPLFSGYVYVVEEEWLFKSVDLNVSKSSGINILDSLYFKQTYNQYQNTDIWVIQNQTLIPYINMLGIGIGGSFITNYKNQKVNHEIPQDVFNQKYLSVYDSTALDKPKEYWDTARVIPLTAEEQRDFVFINRLVN